MSTSEMLTVEIGFFILAQSYSHNSARDGRQTCCPAANFSVTKMQEDSIIQSPCFFELRQTCRPSRAKLGLKDWANGNVDIV
jgi:hypothetical protein